MKNRSYKCLALAFGIAVLNACSSSESAENKTSEKRVKKTVSVKFGTVTLQKVGQHIQLPGEFLAFQEVNIYPKADGFVEKVLVDRGSPVRKGQVLMVLEAPETEEQLVAARSNYLKAKAMLVASQEHYKRLKASAGIRGSVSALDLESANAKMMSDSAAAMGEQANFGALTTIKSYLIVRAPFDGVITERNVHPGALVGSGVRLQGPMLMLQQQNRLRLVVDVPETYSVALKQGKEVTFTINAMPGKQFKGKISRRSGNMNQKFRSETVEIDVANAGREIKPGMYAEVVFAPEGTQGSLTVPSSSVVTSTEGQYVIKVVDGKTEFVEIRKGMQEDDLTEVFGALREGDKVVTNPRDDMKNGTTIDIMKNDESSQ
ncbi:efflux RND transporter periplasmic adaptor subunit [Dyadobacter luticola]|nr:efflux RND transporter periplasmic adaptor subunit [Dyadobacter luticola]